MINMSPSQPKMERGIPTKTLFLVIGILALTLSLPVLTRPSFAASSASVSLSYSMKSGTLLVTLSAKDSQFPSQVVAKLFSFYNGASTPFNKQNVVLSTTGSDSVAFTYTVPFQGNGNYKFVGGIYDTHGNLILSASIDPFIKTGH